MNLVQIIRKARLSCDAILPGNTPSKMWADDELVELVNEAQDRLDASLRLQRKGYGLQTVKYGDTAFTRNGITYTPSTSLLIAAGAVSTTLPPDFAEISRIICLDNSTVRFVPGEFNSPYWIDMDQSARSTDGTVINALGLTSQTVYYDITGQRTLQVTPPMPASAQLQVDYYPIKQMIVYSTQGTLSIAHNATAVTIEGGTLVQDGIFTSTSGQQAELLATIVGLADKNVRLDRRYPLISSIDDDAHLTLVQPWPGVSLTDVAFTVAMTPTAPEPMHRTVGQLTAALMFRKISSDLAVKLSTEILSAFEATIKPSTVVRQSQDSVQTDDNLLLGGLANF